MTVEEDFELTLEPNGGWDQRIRVARCGDMVRSYLIKSERFLVVYDTLLGPSSGAWLREQAEAFADGRPILVVTSHADWDHYFGTMSFDDCLILGTSECARRIQGTVGAGELARKREQRPQDYEQVRLVPPSLLIEEGQLEGGDLSFRLLKTTGHRPDHLALFLPQISTLLPGDCVEEPIPLVDEDSAPHSNTIAELANSLETMLALRPSWVLANHAAPEAGTARLQRNLDYLRKLKSMADEASGEAELLQAWPPPTEWSEDYRQAHRAHLAMAWQQRRTSG